MFGYAGVNNAASRAVELVDALDLIAHLSRLVSAALSKPALTELLGRSQYSVPLLFSFSKI